MKFIETPLAGALLVSPEPLADERGFFARTFCAREFASLGLADAFVQCSISHNTRLGTLRGMHFQRRPRAEAKLVRCTQGAIFDAIVDLREDSPFCLKWFGIELSAENGLALYIPKGFSHGFQTLTDNAQVFYQISEFFAPGHGSGHRYDDPAVGIAWPLPVSVISDKDLALPLTTDLGPEDLP